MKTGGFYGVFIPRVFVFSLFVALVGGCNGGFRNDSPSEGTNKYHEFRVLNLLTAKPNMLRVHFEHLYFGGVVGDSVCSSDSVDDSGQCGAPESEKQFLSAYGVGSIEDTGKSNSRVENVEIALTVKVEDKITLNNCTDQIVLASSKNLQLDIEGLGQLTPMKSGSSGSSDGSGGGGSTGISEPGIEIPHPEDQGSIAKTANDSVMIIESVNAGSISPPQFGGGEESTASAVVMTTVSLCKVGDLSKNPIPVPPPGGTEIPLPAEDFKK